MSSQAMGCETTKFEIVPCRPLSTQVVPSAFLSASIILGSPDVKVGGCC